MSKSLFVLASLFCFLLHSWGYEILIFGDIHYDSQEVRFTPEGSAKPNLPVARNVKGWAGPIPTLLKEAEAYAATRKPAFAIQLGDIVHGSFGDQAHQELAYQRVLEAIHFQTYPVPFYIIKGNHEYYGNSIVKGEKIDFAIPAYNNVMLPILEKAYQQKAPESKLANFWLMQENDLYIFLDSVKADWNFIEKTVAEHPNFRHLFLITHLPLLPCSTNAPTWTVFGSAQETPQRKKLLSLMAKHNGFVICGHIHLTQLTRYQTTEGTITQLANFSLPQSQGAPVISELCYMKQMEQAIQNKNTKARKAYSSSPEFIKDFDKTITVQRCYQPHPSYNIYNITDSSITVFRHFPQSKAVHKIVLWEKTKK